MRLLGALVASLVLSAPASAGAAVSVSPNRVVVSTAGASAVVQRHPFALSFMDSSGRTVLRELPAAGGSGAALPLPDSVLGGSAVRAPTLYAPLAFTVGSEQELVQQSGLWTGDLLASARNGVQYAAGDVISAAPSGAGARLVLSTSDPTGRQLIVTLGPDRGAAIHVSVRPSSAVGVAAMSDAFSSTSDEAFHGFGGRHDGLDQHGRALYSWAEEENVSAGSGQPIANALPGGGPSYQFPSGGGAAYYPQPLFFSSHGYGFLVDQPELARFRLDSDRSDAWQVDAASPRLDYVVAPGSPPAAIGTMTAITGRQPVPPAWGLGPMLDRLEDLGPTSSTSAYTAEVKADIANIDRYRPPLTAYRVEGWDTLTAEQNVAFFSELRRRGIHPLVYFRSYISNQAHGSASGSLPEAIQRGFLATTATGAPYLFATPENSLGGVLDYTNPAAVAWWQQHIRAALDLGADGFMQDFGEQVLPDMHFADGETGLTMHNTYPVLYHRATREVLDSYARSHPGRSFFFYTRAGYTGRPGSAAFESANFPGDETTDWSPSGGLQSIIPDMLNRAVGGAYGYGTDIGGYVDYVTPKTTKELFLRWAEAAALMPVFRLHGSTLAGTHTPWSYDSETVAIYNQLSALHEAASGLILRLWGEAQATGMPPTRPLWLGAPGDAGAAGADQEWLLGSDVLVAPVVVQGTVSRSVYFPTGCWVDQTSGVVYRGPRALAVGASLGVLPYFFRCGTHPFGSSGCVDRRHFVVPLPYATRGRVIRAVVRVSGRRGARVLRGRNLRRVVLTPPPASGVRFVVRVVAFTDRGWRITSTRSYRGCVQTRRRETVARAGGKGR